MRDLHVSWDEYNRLIEKLAVRVHDANWHFDAIVCLARGGLRVGDALSRLFRRPLGVLFTSSYRDNAGTTQSRLMIAEHMSSAEPLCRLSSHTLDMILTLIGVLLLSKA